MKNFFIIGCLSILAVSCTKAPMQSPAPLSVNSGTQTRYNRQLQIKDKILNIEIVTANVDMEKGLSNRPSMQEDQGMLFDFGNDSKPGFWMKDMKFSLDLIWINNGKIIGITKNIPAPNGNWKLPVYYPPGAIDKVLEVNAGWSERNNIKIGDEIRLVN